MHRAQGSDGKHVVLQGLDTSVKNFLTSVPLVADLRSPAMRDRHWTQLMTTTKVSAADGRRRHHLGCSTLAVIKLFKEPKRL